MRGAALVVLLAAAVVVLAARAEEEPKPKDPKADALALIDKGRAALVADKGQEAIDCLQKAIVIIQESVETGFAGFLPGAFEGWTREEPDTGSGSWGTGGQSFQWATASAEYRRESDGLDVDVSISSSPQMVQAQRAMLDMYKNPQMRKMLEMDENKKVEFIDEGAWGGLLMTEKDGDSTLVAISGKVMVTIDVGKPLPDVTRKFWEAIDRKGLAEAGKE